MARFILDINEEHGVTIVLIEHDMGVVMDLADRGLVNLSKKEQRLSEANQSLTDLNAGKIKGRAVLIP
jgi:branched-chain amino acid transport system ATP-binding protein